MKGPSTTTAWRGVILAFILACATGDTVVAQWVSLPLPGTPRTSDGTPNLKAPTPRTADGNPDLSGIWRADDNRYNANLLARGTEAPMLPWAAELYKRRVDTIGYDRPGRFCMPHGIPDAMTVAGLPFKILQMPSVTVVLFEEFHKYRQIHTDGRQLPVDPDPAWYGYRLESGRARHLSPKPLASRKAAGSTTTATRTPSRSARLSVSAGLISVP